MTDLKDVLKRYRQIKAEAKATATEYSKRLTVIEDWLRVKLQESGSDTLKTSEGLVMQYDRRSTKVTDLSAFKAWCIEHEVDGLKETIDGPEMLSWIDSHKELPIPDGLTLEVSKVLAVKGTTDA